MNNFFDALTLPGIFMIILIGFFFFDNTQKKQIDGELNTDEKDAKEKNPFIK